MTKKPEPTSSLADKEMKRLESEFDAFDNQVKSLNIDAMNHAPKQESEIQVPLSSKQLENSKEIYLKPKRTISSREKFNERFRSDYEFQKEYVKFTAQNNEIIGETIEMWTKPFPGMPAEEWAIPTNKPIWAPRYVAEQIKRASHHKLTMQQKVITSTDGMGEYFGSMVASETVQRLDAIPFVEKKSIFMGAGNF